MLLLSAVSYFKDGFYLDRSYIMWPVALKKVSILKCVRVVGAEASGISQPSGICRVQWRLFIFTGENNENILKSYNEYEVDILGSI